MWAGLTPDSKGDPTSTTPLLSLNDHGALHRPRNASATTLRIISLSGYRRAAFYNGLKSKVGLAAAKAAALRVNLNINGCSIVAPPARPSRSSRASLAHSLLSHSLPMPHVH